MSGAPVAGHVAPGFEPVREAFERNFAERGEVGAAFAVYRDDELVVDLWGGVADRVRRAPWTHDTMVVVFSGTKGWVAACMLILIERGLLDLDAPVTRYWPEFGQAGKQRTLARHVVAHVDGLPGLRRRLREDDIYDERLMVSLLEREAPYWPPGERLAYHPLTFGWLCGELVRRIDGRSVGRFFREEVADPLALDAWIGLPEEHEHRVAQLSLAADWGKGAEQQAGADPLAATVWDNPSGRLSPPLAQNTRAFHAAEIPSSGGIATARSIARLYACLARGGELDGVRLLSPGTITLGRRCIARGPDPFVGRPFAFGVGFQLQTELRHFGPVETAFGHGGLGGSIHGAWPEQRVGFSYAMSELRSDDPDQRHATLLDALKRVVDERLP